MLAPTELRELHAIVNFVPFEFVVWEGGLHALHVRGFWKAEAMAEYCVNCGVWGE